MLYPDELIEEVRLRNDIVDVVSSYVKLERKGRRYFGNCPFHNEKTPSFSVEPGKQFFYCFGCNKGGSVFQFVMSIENLDFPEALRFLADRSGITLPEPEDKGEKERSNRKKTVLELNKEAARFFFTNLAGKTGYEGQAYLRRRGLMEKTIRQFGLGLSTPGWDELSRYLMKKGVSEELLLESGLALKGKKGDLVDRFRNRLMFPIFDIRGNIIGFGGRVLGNDQPKYMNSPDTIVYNKSRELYALNFARLSSAKELLIVEGYMDVISLHQAGFTNTVASLGTALTQMQAWLLKKYAKEVIVSYDSDAAGQAATMRGLEILEEAGCPARVLQIPEGKDPDEFIRNNSPEKFKILVDRAISLLDYKIKVEKNVHNLDTVDDKLKLLNSIADILAGHENNIEREIYAQNYAEEYGISLQSLQNEIARRIRMNSKSGGTSRPLRDFKSQAYEGQPSISSDTRYSELEYMLIVLLCHENRLFKTVAQRYALNRFKDEKAAQAAEKLYSRLNEGKPCMLVDLLNETDMYSAAHLVRIAETKCDFEDSAKAIGQILNKLELFTLEDLQKETIERIKNEQNGEKRQELGIEFGKRSERIAELKRMS